VRAVRAVSSEPSTTGTSFSSITADFDLKANVDSPVFTGTVSGINKAMVGLSNVDNTSDADKNTAAVTLSNKTLDANTIGVTVTDPSDGSTKLATTGFVQNVLDAVPFTGTGEILVKKDSPILITPALGTPSALVGTNITGTASGLTAGNVTTNANLTGEVTSTGNATTLTNSAVIGKVLTGFTSGAGTISATDNILEAVQKLNGNMAINANLTGMVTSSGNATTVITNADLTGDVTSVGNLTTIGALSITNAQLEGSIDLTAKVTGVLPVANGGTGSSTQNYVDLTTNQSVAGTKTFSSAVTAASFIKTDGTASEYLMADGSVSTGAAAVREVADEFSATASQTSFTLTQSPSTNSKVKMYINGIRISNAAYSLLTNEISYDEAENGDNTLVAGDRIQFDYYY
jgi:hypothetical protein